MGAKHEAAQEFADPDACVRESARNHKYMDAIAGRQTTRNRSMAVCHADARGVCSECTGPYRVL